MQDLADLTGGPDPAPTSDGGQCEFVELSVREIANLLRSRRDARRAQLIGDYHACGQTSDQTADALDRLADRTWDGKALAELAADRIDGQPAVLLASLAKTYHGRAEAMLDAVQLADEQRFALAAQVLGLTLSYDPPDPSRGKPAPRADAGIGHSTDTSSNTSGPALPTPSA